MRTLHGTVIVNNNNPYYFCYFISLFIIIRLFVVIVTNRVSVEPAISDTFNRSLQDFPYYNLPVYSGHLYITAILTSPLGGRY